MNVKININNCSMCVCCVYIYIYKTIYRLKQTLSIYTLLIYILLSIYICTHCLVLICINQHIYIKSAEKEK